MSAPIAESNGDITELGKRKNREDGVVDQLSQQNGESRKKYKMIVPENLKLSHQNIVGVLLGPKGSTLFALQDKTGAKISIRGRGSCKDSSKEIDADQPLHILIEGNDENVAAARRDIEAIFNDPGEAGRLSQSLIKTHKIYIPEKVSKEMNILGVLIGPRASTLRAMQEKTGAKISIRGKGSSKEPKTDLDSDQQLHVLIEGTDLAIAVATRDIEGIINDPAQANRLKLQQLSEMQQQKKREMMSSMGPPGGGYGPPPPMYGAGGSYGPPMGMMVPSYRPPFNPGTSGIPSMQPPMGRPTYNASTYSSSGQGEEEITVSIPNNVVGVIVGKGGSNLERIRQNFNVEVRVMKHDQIPGQIYMVPLLFKGARSAIESARKSVMNKVTERQRQIAAEGGMPNGMSSMIPMQTTDLTVDITVPNDRVGLVIGKGGANIKNLQNRTGASVKIPTGPDIGNPQVRTLTVSGSNQTAVDSALSEIRSLVQSGPASTNGPALNMRIPSDKVGLVLGKGGVTVKEIHSRTGATIRIDIPSQGDPTSLQATRAVTIYGNPDATARAKAEIENLIAMGPGGAGYDDLSGGYGNPPGLVDPYRQQFLQQKGGQQQQQALYQPSPYQTPSQPAPAAQYSSSTTPQYHQQGQYASSNPQGQYGQPAQSTYTAGQAPGYPGSSNGAPMQYPPQNQPQYAQQRPATQPTQYYTQPTATQSQYQPQQTQPQQGYYQQSGQTQNQQYTTQAMSGGQNAGTSGSNAGQRVDPTQYYQMFWQYAAYYGEKVAREQYGAWSPPIGTAPPPGVVLPLPGHEHPVPARTA